VKWWLVEAIRLVMDFISLKQPPFQIKSTHHLYLLQLDPDRLKGDIQDLKEKLTQKGVVQIPHFAP